MSFGNAAWIWKNGSLVPWAEATFHVSAHGLHYGRGVFEGIGRYETENGPAVFRLPEPLDRFHPDLSGLYICPCCVMGSGSPGLHLGK